MACKELTLDTKGSCFLCLTRAPTPAPTSQTDTKVGTGTSTTDDCHLTVQSLGNICRLLKINPYSVLIKSIGGCGGDENSKAAISFGEFLVNSEGKNTKCDFSASLCQACYPVANKLCSLSEELRMKIEMTREEVEKFHGILSVTPSPSTDDQDLQETSPKGNAEVETKLIENLREEMEHKSHSYLKRDTIESPKTCHTNFDTNPHHDLVTIEEYRKRVRTPSSENSNEYQGATQRISHLSKKLRRNTPSPSSLSTDKASPASTESVTTQDDHEDPPVLDLAHYKCLRIADRCQCPFCGDLFSPSVSLEDGIDFHLILNHLPKIYWSKNVSNLTAPAFEDLCHQVVHQVVLPSSMSMPSDHDKADNLIYSCSECNNIYKTSTWATFHFVMDHFKSFEDKLISVQAQQSNQHLGFNQQALQYHNSSVTVPVSKLEDHKNFSAYPTPSTKPMDNMFHDLINLPNDDSSSNSNHSSQRSEYHHPPAIQPTPSATPHPRPPRSVSRASSALSECHGQIIGDKIQCTFCKAMFGAGKSSSSAIRLHVACFHPEKLFSANKLPEINEATFFQLCRDVIKNELRAAQQKSGGSSNILSCSDCNKTFTRMHNLKYHCVNSHFEIMAKKLVRLQEDYLKEKSSASAMQPQPPSPSPLPPMLTSTSLEQQHQWHGSLMTEEQSKSTESGTSGGTTPAGTTFTTESMQFPNFSFSSTPAVGAAPMQMQTRSDSFTTSAANSTSVSTTNEIIWSKTSMPTGPPPAHQIKTEGLYYQDPATTTTSESQVYNTSWLPQPPPETQVLSQNYYNANSLPPSQYQLINQNYYDMMALNQMSHQGPPPTWLRSPYTDEQNYNDNQMQVVKQEEEKPSNNFQTSSVPSPLPPIATYLNSQGDGFTQDDIQCQEVTVDNEDSE